MQAMVLTAPRQPLIPTDLPTPRPAAGQVAIAIRACAVCRTDLHVVDGELTRPKLPLVPGHEIIGEVVEIGAGVDRFKPSDRVAVPGRAWACGDSTCCCS